MALPIILIYRTGGGIPKIEQPDLPLSMLSLANIGYDEVHCAFSSFSLGKLDMTCPYGKLTTIMPGGIGINAYNIKNRKLCQQHDSNPKRKVLKPSENYECTKFIMNYGIGFTNDWNKACLGKTHCSIEVNKNNMNYFNQYPFTANPIPPQ